jgi:hypothetical protein
MNTVIVAFTFSPISLIATTKEYVFFFIVYASAQFIHLYQHKPKADMCHSSSSHPGLPETS